MRGVGIHTGRDAEVNLIPAAFGTGVVFVVDGVEVPATLEHAHPVPGATTLRARGARVQTPEHLMAALRGAGVTDARIRLHGPELPALDGAALAWLDLLHDTEEGPALELRPVQPGRVAVAGGEVELVALGPGQRPTVSVEVDFPGGPHGRATWDGTPAGFRRGVAWAQTFVFDDEVAALQAAGRGRGASDANTRVLPRVRRAAEQDEGARCAVVHKLLDAIGDLALLPPLGAHVLVRRGSHQVHIEGLRALLMGQGMCQDLSVR